jgi:uncharacterized protein (DUF2147 family)
VAGWRERVGRAGCLAALVAQTAAAQAPAGPVGVWVTQDGDARVKVEPCHRHQERLCGYMVWVADAEAAPASGASSLVGFRLLSRFVPDGRGGWTGGEILDPRSGRAYRAKMALRSPDELQVSGCFLVFCGSQIWRRYRP